MLPILNIHLFCNTHIHPKIYKRNYLGKEKSHVTIFGNRQDPKATTNMAQENIGGQQSQYTKETAAIIMMYLMYFSKCLRLLDTQSVIQVSL